MDFGGRHETLLTQEYDTPIIYTPSWSKVLRKKTLKDLRLPCVSTFGPEARRNYRWWPT